MNPRTLTPRERQVAHRVSQGLTAGQIGKELGIAETTVRFYVHKIAERVPGRGLPMRRIAVWWIEAGGEEK